MRRSLRCSLSSAALAVLMVLPACKDDGKETGDTDATTADADAGEDTADEETTSTSESGDAATEEGDTAGDTGDSETTAGDEGTFVDSDMVAGCGTMCDIWTPGDCPEGEKCTSVACEPGSTSWDSNVCRPITGDGLEGDDCMGAGTDGNDDCAEGLMCWDANPDTGLGTCVAFCIGSATSAGCANEDFICDITNNGTLPLCIPKCDPLAIDCPNPDNICAPDSEGNGFACSTNASGNMHPNGTPCQFINQCNIGLLCEAAELNPAPECAGASACCTPVCDTSEPNTCPGMDQGQVCIPYYDEGMVPPGYENVGICGIPGGLIDDGQTLNSAPVKPVVPFLRDAVKTAP